MAPASSDSPDLAQVATAFAVRARRYCSFLETMRTLTPQVRIRTTIRLLTELVGAATELPELSDSDVDSGTEVERVTAPSFDFNTVDLYYEVFDPFVRDALVLGSLSDDLGGIYVDLREGLDLMDGGHRNDAIWQWRFGYQTHWGDHAVDALRALHRLATGRGRDIAKDA